MERVKRAKTAGVLKPNPRNRMAPYFSNWSSIKDSFSLYQATRRLASHPPLPELGSITSGRVQSGFRSLVLIMMISFEDGLPRDHCIAHSRFLPKMDQ